MWNEYIFRWEKLRNSDCENKIKSIENGKNMGKCKRLYLEPSKLWYIKEAYYISQQPPKSNANRYTKRHIEKLKWHTKTFVILHETKNEEQKIKRQDYFFNGWHKSKYLNNSKYLCVKHSLKATILRIKNKI